MTAGKSHLADMNMEERSLMVALPYRVGVWMSHADDEAGEKDDKLEMAALEKSLEGFAKLSDKAPALVREICQETVNHKNEWPAWEQTSLNVLSDCEKAAQILHDKTDMRARKNYKKLLMVIASRVAGAHGEFGDMEEEESFADRTMNAIKGLLGGGDPDDGFANISPAEEAALQELKTALHIDEDQ